MRSIQEHQKNQIISMLNDGQTIRQVAEKISVSTATVSRVGKLYCSEREKDKGGRREVLSAADKRYCVRLVTKGRVDSASKVRKQFETIIRRLLVLILSSVLSKVVA